MADFIRVDTNCYEDIASRLRRLASSLNSLEGDLRSVRIDETSGADVDVSLSSCRLSSVGYRVYSGDAQSCMRSLASALGRLDQHASKLSRSVQRAGECFEDNERDLINRFSGLAVPDSILDDLGSAMGLSPDKSTWTAQQKKNFADMLDTVKIMTDGPFKYVQTMTGLKLLYIGSHLVSTGTVLSQFGGKQTTYKFSDGSMLREESGLSLKGPSFSQKVAGGDNLASYQWNSKDGETDKPVKRPGVDSIGLLTIGAKHGEAYSILGTEGEYKNGKHDAKGYAGLGNAGYAVKGEGGIGLKRGDDGSYDLTLGAKGEIGASVSVAEAGGSYEYELIDNVKFVSEGKASVLEGEAKLEGGLGVVDGEFVANVSASAEANLAEAEGSVGVDVVGIKGTIGGSVSIGIGAHADVGYEDGKFKVDIGAALGPGVSIKGEIDASGLIKNVGDGLKDLGNGFKAVGKSIASWVA